MLVTEADRGGWAAVGGLRADDLIQAVDGQQITAVKELETSLAGIRKGRPEQIIFFIRRGVHTMFVELEPRWPEIK